ncbi:hypothetical protein BDF20DRAFT_868225 [Mycotypha africana]|uniref:uncharacterized protein n=1 Tax=Mycotypha africana TaxID=64632 RepID=UPI0023015DD1|nr:uncharacterized protein BDF20DRAFT_868225 [Mycotypha africana]KAI8979207.1 hypothetical protein BDF20DRAFT_868225 [Mycotypha africana]
MANAVTGNLTDNNDRFKPNFDRLKTMTEEQFFRNLKQVVSGNEIEAGYREMFDRAIQDYERLKTKSVDQQRDVYTVYERYKILEEMYIKEHERVLEAEDKRWILDNKLKEQEKTINELKEEVEKYKNLYKTSREEYTLVTTKQALGRKNIEQHLMHKAIELAEVKKKADEKENEVVNLSKQLEATMKETESLKEVVSYLQNVLGSQLTAGARSNGL